MLRIRLKRLGRKHRPFYRIVVSDIRGRRDGASLAELGFYDPISKQLKLDKNAAQDWVRKGAQPTDAVERLIGKADDSGALITLPKVKKQQLSRKALEKAKKEAEAAAAASESA